MACAFHALRSHDRERMRTRSLGMEVLLHASGSHHVDKALDAAGLVEGEEDFWLLLFKESGPEPLQIPSEERLAEHLGLRLLLGVERDEYTDAGVERAALLGL